MSLEKEVIIKFEEVEKRMHSINKKINDLKTDLQNSMPVETFNFFEHNVRYPNQRGFSFVTLERIYFLCNKSSLVKINITAEITVRTTVANTAIFYFLLNSSTPTDAIYTETFPHSGTFTKTFNVEHEFYPTKENNFVQLRLNTGIVSPTHGNIEFTLIDATITGRNVILLSRNNNFKVYISKDNYYLTKNTQDGGYYLLSPTNNVDLSADFTPIPNVVPGAMPSYNNRYFPFNYTYMPKIVYNEPTQKYTIDHSVNYFIFCVNMNYLMTSGIGNPADGTSLIDWNNKGWAYVVGHPGNADTSPRNMAFVQSSSANFTLPGLTNSEAVGAATVYLKINGVQITGNWVANTVVFAKKWEDDINFPYMCVATDEYGENYFFPNRSATYTVNLGKGIQVNAYLQDDNSINVYLRWINSVYKKTLIYNYQKSKYELSDKITEYKDAWEIIEGYSSDYFINNKGTWTYVP